MSIYDQDLDKNPANFVALSPVSFVERSAEVFGDLPAVIHGQRRYTWAQTRERSARLAAVLITDREFAPTMREVLRLLRDEHGRTPVVIDVCDSEYGGAGDRLGAHEYEALLAEHEPLPSLDGPR